MIKVFYYELRRLVLSKFFLGMLPVILWYAWSILNTSTILGVAHTAPFSPWSFGSYLSQLLPLLSAALLFFLWNQCNEQARNTEHLTAATPVRPECYLLVKYAAAAVAWLVIALLAALLGIGFLSALFGDDVPYAELLLPALIALLPPLLFLSGVGLLAGRACSVLLFAIMALAFGLGLLPLPMTAELYSTSFFAEYPLTLATLDPAFVIPLEVVSSKLMFAASGLLLFLAAFSRFCRGAAFGIPRIHNRLRR